MRIIEPPRDQHPHLRQPLTAGELRVLDMLDDKLPPEWEIYLQPYFNGLKPDFVLLEPNVGIGVIEVKDWNLDAMPYFVKEYSSRRKELYATGADGRDFRVENPFARIRRYKEAIYSVYCPRLAEKYGFGTINGALAFTAADRERVLLLQEPFLRSGEHDRRHEYWPVIGRRELDAGCVETLLPLLNRKGKSYMRPDLADDLRGWLVEPDFSQAQRMPLEMDQKQRELAQTRTKSGYRRLKGAAGSGKSLVLAAKAAKLVDEGKDVLVVTFNMTLWHYLRDLVMRARKGGRRGGTLTFTHFHSWCRDVCQISEAFSDEYPDCREAARAARSWDRHRSGRRPGVERSDDPSSPAAPRPAVAPVSSGLSQQVLQNHVVEHDICHQAFQLGVLVLKLLQAFGVGQVHPTILSLQLVKRRWAQPMLAAQLRRGQASLLLLDHPDNLRLGETAFPHVVCSFRLGRLYIRLRELPGGRSATLDVSYRLPPKLLTLSQDFAKRFLPEATRIIPEPENDELDYYPCELRWTQCDEQEAANNCVNSVLSLMKQTGLISGLSNSDIVLLTESHEVGRQIVEELDREPYGISCTHIFAEGKFEQDRRKMAFFVGQPRVKAATIHSFKGWESRMLVLHLNKAIRSEDLAGAYAAITRLKRDVRGSYITVVCSAPQLADYGRTWPIFEDMVRPHVHGGT